MSVPDNPVPLVRTMVTLRVASAPVDTVLPAASWMATVTAGESAVPVLTLGLGIAVNTTVFSWIDTYCCTLSQASAIRTNLLSLRP